MNDPQRDGPAVPARPDPDTFGGTGIVTDFRGPYADGPPPAALVIDAPPIDRFRLTELRRMVAIVAVLVATLVRALAVKLVRPGRESWAAAASRGLVDAFVVLGPTFVKLGQLIASSPGLFPARLADECLRCLDEVPPFPGDAARRLIREDLGKSPAQLFASFDDQPLSAASIAQVHACELPDGREAVIKLQRPDITGRMNTDLRIMYRLARLLMRTETGRQANIQGVVEDLHTVTNEELNFALEAHRQTRFRENIDAFGDNEWITAPEVYWDYCGPRMVCMERMRGIPMDEFDTLRSRDIDGELILRRGVKVWMEAAMVHGPFHGDVHAGNLWVLDDGRAAFLDFGIMGELDEGWREAFCNLQYTAMIDGDYARIVRSWKEMGVFPEDVGDDEEVGLRIKLVVDPLLDQSIGEISLGELMRQDMELAGQFGAKAPQEMVLISKQLLYFERYAKALAPDYVMSRDIFLVRNVFPEAVAAKAAAEGIDLPE